MTSTRLTGPEGPSRPSARADQLFALQRRERLMDQLRLHGAVRVRELARDLSVSELTIRRDIAALAERGLLTRVHGGATLPSALEQEPVRRRRLAMPAFTIGMVVPSLDFYWPHIVSGVRNAAAAHGVNVQLRGSSYDQAEDRRQIVRLTESGQVQGLLLAPNLCGPARARRALSALCVARLGRATHAGRQGRAPGRRSSRSPPAPGSCLPELS